MRNFFRSQISKIAWRRITIFAIIWTFYAIQARGIKYDYPSYYISYGLGSIASAITIMAIAGAAFTKTSNKTKVLAKDVDNK